MTITNTHRITRTLCLALVGWLFAAATVPLHAQTTTEEADTTDVSTPRKKSVVLYFRWDKSDLQRDYMDNSKTLQEIDRIFSNEEVINNMDSIVITASASPEGKFLYNLRLSERRVGTVAKYMHQQFPSIASNKIRSYGLGENWAGLLRMVEEDYQVPYRDDVLKLLRANYSPAERERRLNRVGHGESYRYINAHIFPFLRTGATFALFYPKRIEHIVNPTYDPLPHTLASEVILASTPPIAPTVRTAKFPARGYIRPVALKTNLLGDAASLFNVELEVPIGRHFSVLGEWTFPWWGGLGNRGGVVPLPAYSERYTVQMLSGGLEARYWFNRNKKLNERAQQWGDYNPLCGWFAGIYTGAGLYDFQLQGKGMQGEFYLAAGLSMGYAHPIGKHLHMEYSLGLGYLETKYYNYTARDGHKVVNILPNGQYDYRKQSWLGPTKLKVSFVWIPQFKINTRK